MPFAVGLIMASFPVGILIGLTGIGGAALMMPCLIFGIGAEPHSAVGTDLAYSMFTKAVGSLIYWKRGQIDFRLVVRLSSASLPSASLGTLVMTKVHGTANGEVRLRIILGFVLLLVALASLGRAGPPPKSMSVEGAAVRVATVVYAAVAGFLVGLTGIGSGSLILPLILSVNRLSVPRAVGTDFFHATILVAFSSALHAVAGGVNWAILPWLLAGSVPGVALGSRLTAWLPERFLRLIIMAVLVISAITLLRS